MNTKPQNADCGRIIEQLDLYLDQQMAAGTESDIAAHLDECESCRSELQTRTNVRNRLRAAVRTTIASDDLRARISSAVRHTPSSPPARMWRATKLGIGIAAVVVLGVGIAYQLGHLRLTTASQERYIAAISRRVSAIMRVGLGDHVHCAVFRKYPNQPPPPEQIAADMGPEFVDLVRVVKQHLPPGQRVVMAHRCSYHRRKFVHIAMVDGVHLSSIVIAVRQPGESFDTSGLLPALSDPNLPVYYQKVQRFQIDGFQTSSYLVYLISDLPRDANERMFAKLSRPVREFLLKLES